MFWRRIGGHEIFKKGRVVLVGLEGAGETSTAPSFSSPFDVAASLAFRESMTPGEFAGSRR